MASGDQCSIRKGVGGGRVSIGNMSLAKTEVVSTRAQHEQQDGRELNEGRVVGEVIVVLRDRTSGAVGRTGRRGPIT